MKFENVAVPLVPRSTANCIDLALCFMRQHLKPIAGLWATIAVPACLLVYVLVDQFEFDLSLAIVVFIFASSPLGILLMTGAAPCAFGERFSYRGTLRRLGWTDLWLMIKGLLLRVAILVASMIFIFPGWYLGVKYGFMVEQSVLSKMARHLHDRRADELLQGEISDLVFRSAAIAVFCLMSWWVLLLTADFMGSTLLGWPLLMGRYKGDFSYFTDLGELFGHIFRFLGTDPVVITAELAVAFLVYPIARLAWFFCYIDVRVRRDCWDMELKFLQEAQRLETT
ncbi:MAG: hypothetical protein JSS02_32475 [Planctomycetes bacterium]|nr:hypothetical protein [Planctomycetota bacterium]